MAKPLAFAQHRSCAVRRCPSRISGSQKRRPRTARRRRAMCRQDECVARLLHRRCSAADANECATGARPARREARAPAGPHKDSAPAGAQNARDRARPSKTPAQPETAPDRHPDGPGLKARSAQRIERVAQRAAPRSSQHSLKETAHSYWDTLCVDRSQLQHLWFNPSLMASGNRLIPIPASH